MRIAEQCKHQKENATVTRDSNADHRTPATDAIRFDFANLMSDRIGEARGIRPEQVEAHAQACVEFVEEIRRDGERRNTLEWLDLPRKNPELKRIQDTVDELRPQCDHFVVLGIGGSALGSTAVHSALSHPLYNQLPRERRNGCPQLYVMDSVDPVRFEALLDVIDLSRAHFNVITKSGGTTETMAQFMVVERLLTDLVGKEETRTRIIATTDAAEGDLRSIATREGYRAFTIPKGVGGRFSVLSPAGLLPLAMCGVDVEALLAGAEAMELRCLAPDLWQNPGCMSGALQFIADTQMGNNIVVMMPYAHSLAHLADWYLQLWAESLGKKFHLDGRIANCGSTPVKSLGVTDQHSQMQLYMEGPFDKIVVFLEVESFGASREIPSSFEEYGSTSYLGGHTLAKLMRDERLGVELALIDEGPPDRAVDERRPNCTIALPEISASTIGQLIFMLEIQTAFAGKLYGVNAFDQPGVALSKRNASALLGREGYEEARAAIEGAPEKSRRYLI